VKVLVQQWIFTFINKVVVLNSLKRSYPGCLQSGTCAAKMLQAHCTVNTEKTCSLILLHLLIFKCWKINEALDHSSLAIQ